MMTTMMMMMMMMMMMIVASSFPTKTSYVRLLLVLYFAGLFVAKERTVLNNFSRSRFCSMVLLMKCLELFAV